MRFTVSINGKKFPVYVMKEPSNSLVLSNFNYEGRSYKGSPEQFNGLRFDKAKNRYIATSIAVTENAKVPIENIAVLEMEPEEAQTLVSSIIEDETNTIQNEEQETTGIIINTEELPETSIVTERSSDEELDDTTDAIAIEDSIQLRKQEFLTELIEQSEKLKKITLLTVSGGEISHTNGHKKYRFAPRWQYLFPDNTSWASDFFERQKITWIKMHGSEHLKIAHDMKCRCDSLYIQERAAFEFPKWTLHENLSFYEIDSPDFGILTLDIWTLFGICNLIFVILFYDRKSFVSNCDWPGRRTYRS